MTKRTSTAAGRQGEDLALKFLAKKGYAPVARNFFTRGGEIDLIVKKDGILVFVEVKTRWKFTFGAAEEALTYNKKKTLLRAIFTFLDGLRRPDGRKTFTRWRCDLVAIQFLNPHTAQIKHLTNIFDD